ncbi:MAG TPA: carboxypeptidase regulatory-like domain-containing protein [Planctomycetota bacterium]
MRPLLLLVLAELVVLLLLALQWGARGSTALANASSAPVNTPTSAPVRPEAGLAGSASSRPAERTPAPATLDARVDATDPIGILLTGAIRGSDGTPVEGASAGVRRDREYRSGNSAGPGAFAIGGLQSGEWTLTCRAEGFAPHEASITLDDRAFQRVDVELKPCWTVRVKIQGADGKSLLQELQRKTNWGMPYVIATEAPLAGDLPPTEQSRLIRFGLGEWRTYDGMGGKAQPKLQEQGYCGELLMDRAPPAHASLMLRTTLLQSQRIEPGQKELVFTLEASEVLAKHGTVKLRLVDGTSGNPIAGAGVQIATAQGGGTGGKTGDDGRVVIEHVLPGIGMLQSHQRSQELEGLFRYVRVPSGGTVDLGDVTLTAAQKITGVVVDGDGKPVNGASVQWTELDCRSFPQALVDNRSALADANGKFELWAAGRHRYVVFARLFGGNDTRFGYATVDATAAGPPTVTITVGKPTSVKLDTGFDMTAGRLVTALASDRSPVAVATLGTEYRPKSMLLLPGSYTIEIHDLQTDRLVRSFALQVGSEPLAIEVP